MTVRSKHYHQDCPMDLTTPPVSDPDNLTEVCRILRDSPMPRAEAKEAAESGSRAIGNSITYGVRLGFIDEGEDNRLELTDLGSKLHYERGDDEKVSKLFRRALAEFPTYRRLLEELSISERDVINGKQAVGQTTVVQELDLTLGFDASESTLEEYSNTFLKTLQKSGLGKYVVGRRGYETRLEVFDDFDNKLSEILEKHRIDGKDNFEAKKYNNEAFEEKAHAEGVSQRPANPAIGAQLNIDFSISGDDDPENVLRILQALKQGLDGENIPTESTNKGEDAPQETGNLPSEIEVTKMEIGEGSVENDNTAALRKDTDEPQLSEKENNIHTEEDSDEQESSGEDESKEDEQVDGNDDEEDADANASLTNF